jgi:hypothetical protein
MPSEVRRTGFALVPLAAFFALDFLAAFFIGLSFRARHETRGNEANGFSALGVDYDK